MARLPQPQPQPQSQPWPPNERLCSRVVQLAACEPGTGKSLMGRCLAKPKSTLYLGIAKMPIAPAIAQITSSLLELRLRPFCRVREQLVVPPHLHPLPAIPLEGPTNRMWRSIIPWKATARPCCSSSKTMSDRKQLSTLLRASCNRADTSSLPHINTSFNSLHTSDFLSWTAQCRMYSNHY